LKFAKRRHSFLNKNLKKMKKTLMEAYTEGLLSENAEDALLESYFEHQKKQQFKEKVQRAMQQNAELQHRFKRKLAVALTGGLLIICTGGYYWHQAIQKKEQTRLENAKKEQERIQKEQAQNQSQAFYLQKTVDPAYKPRISEALMSVNQTPVLIPKSVQTAYEAGDYAQAAKGLETLNPKDAAIWSHIGFCYMQIVLDDKALYAFEQSTKMDSNFNGQQNILWWSVLIYCRQNKEAQAKALLETLPEDHYARQEGWVEGLLKKIGK
jgi:tetratricopeptide (TPR) repeat protein